MSFTVWLQAHRRSILSMLALLAAGGIAAAFQLPVTLFPTVDFPRVVVNVDSGDRPADLMVLQVTLPVEEAVRRVPGVVSVRSTTSRGSAELSLNFNWGVDLSTVTLQVQAELDRVLPTLPAGTAFDVRRMSPFVFPVAAYSLTSETLDLTRLHDIAQFELLPLLSSINGIAKVEVLGGHQREFRVDADRTRLESNGLGIDDLLKAITASNVLEVVGRTEDRHKLLLTLVDNSLKKATK